MNQPIPANMAGDVLLSYLFQKVATLLVRAIGSTRSLGGIECQALPGFPIIEREEHTSPVEPGDIFE